jgi:GAF domain-containing protein
LKYSPGKYKNIIGEFSKVSVESNKIGPIVKTHKPAITNDVPNDPRIRHPDWAGKEKLRSFAGYPKMYRNKSFGVLNILGFVELYDVASMYLINTVLYSSILQQLLYSKTQLYVYPLENL